MKAREESALYWINLGLTSRQGQHQLSIPAQYKKSINEPLNSFVSSHMTTELQRAPIMNSLTSFTEAKIHGLWGVLWEPCKGQGHHSMQLFCWFFMLFPQHWSHREPLKLDAPDLCGSITDSTKPLLMDCCS